MKNCNLGHNGSVPILIHMMFALALGKGSCNLFIRIPYSCKYNSFEPMGFVSGLFIMKTAFPIINQEPSKMRYVLQTQLTYCVFTNVLPSSKKSFLKREFYDHNNRLCLSWMCYTNESDTACMGLTTKRTVLVCKASMSQKSNVHVSLCLFLFCFRCLNYSPH